MRHLFDARPVNDAFGDPGLYIDLHGERRALLFDLGELSALPPRKLLRLSHVFVSHAHMDHFCGFDALLRVVLGRKRLLVLTGGPGFVDQLEHKLRAYTWNVVQRYEVPLELAVREVHADGGGRAARFSSRDGFARRDDPGFAGADGDVLLDEPLLRVRGRFVDHGIACLAFVVEEKARVRLARDRLAAIGAGTGAWLRALKQAVRDGAPDDTPIALRWRDRAGEHAATRPLAELRSIVLDVGRGQRIGYVTDLRHTEANVEALRALLAGVDLLFIEAVFLESDRAHAGRKNHLTAHQAGLIARAVGARAVVPFHFSPRYADRADALRAELAAAWQGGDHAPSPASRACSRAML